MAMCIAVMGESGSGKTTSMRNLPPDQTMYIDCDQKGLSWKGWRKAYNTESKNYLKSSNKETIMTLFQRINSDKAFVNVKYIVVDTINGIMANAMEVAGATEIQTSIGKWRIQKNPPSVNVVDASKIPKRFLIQQEPAIDKKAMLTEFRNTGEEIDGVEITQTEGVRFR